MKKTVKAKTGKRAKTSEPQLPSLVEGIAKLVERLESLERKTDQVLGRVSNLPQEMRRAVQDVQRPQAFAHTLPVSRPEQSSQQGQGPRERMLHQAICADCRKNCEVPFRPSGDRPVYCPECWAIRKVGHVPKDLTSGVVVPKHIREMKPAPAASVKPEPASKDKKIKKQKPAKKKKKK